MHRQIDTSSRPADSIKIGACEILVFPIIDGVAQKTPMFLGYTKGGITVTYTPEVYDIVTDQTGTAPLDTIVTGETVVVTGKLLSTSLDKIEMLYGVSESVKDGDEYKSITFGSYVGRRLGKYSIKVLIKPIAALPGDDSSNIIIYRATNTGAFTASYSNDTEFGIDLNLVGMIDTHRKNGDMLFRIGTDGDSTAEKRIVNFWIEPSNHIFTVGETVNYTSTVMYEDGTQEVIVLNDTFSISDTQIAEIEALTSDYCEVMAKKEGTTLIVATYKDQSASTMITVKGRE